MKGLSLTIFSLFILLGSTSGQILWPKSKKFWKKNGYIDAKAKVVFSGYQQLLYIDEDGVATIQMHHLNTLSKTHRIQFKDNSWKERHGLYQEWYDNGQLWVSGYYKDGLRSGQWENFHHPDGALKSKFSYKDGELHGPRAYYNSDGLLIRKTAFDAGVEVGPVVDFSPEGDTLRICPLTEGDTILCHSLLEDIDGPFKLPESLPYLTSGSCGSSDRAELKKCRDKEFLKQLNRRIKYPKVERELGVQGLAIIQFVIEKDGSVTISDFLRGVSHGFEKALVKAVSKLPKWSPGTQDGKPVRVLFNLPVNFRLE